MIIDEFGHEEGKKKKTETGSGTQLQGLLKNCDYKDMQDSTFSLRKPHN